MASTIDIRVISTSDGSFKDQGKSAEFQISAGNVQPNIRAVIFESVTLQFQARKTNTNLFGDDPASITVTAGGEQIGYYHDAVPDGLNGSIDDSSESYWSQPISVPVPLSYFSSIGNLNSTIIISIACDRGANSTWWKIRNLQMVYQYKKGRNIDFQWNDGGQYIDIVNETRGGYSYYDDDLLTVTAINTTGYHWNSWEGITSNTNPFQLTVSETTPSIIKAIFEPNSYTLKFNSNTGSGEMASQNLNYISEFILPECNFTGPERSVRFDCNGNTVGSDVYYYTHNLLPSQKWLYIKPDNSIVEYSAGTNITKKFPVEHGSEVVLYADWTDKINFDVISAPYREFHTFEGWQSKSGQIYYPGLYEGIQYTEDISELIAQWEKTQFRIFLKEDNDLMQVKKIPYLYLKSKKIKKIFIYTPTDGFKEV